jgi:hypothetical protein
MATETLPRQSETPPPAPRRSRWWWLPVGVVLVAVTAGLVAALTLSGVTLDRDGAALARIHVQALGGKLRDVSATDAHGHSIPLTVAGGKLTPARPVAPGERISVRVSVRRPGWDGWLLGHTRTERLTITAPVARPQHRFLTRPEGDSVPVAFTGAVARASYSFDGSTLAHPLRGSGHTVTVASGRAAGAVRIAVAPRPWERLGKPVLVRWFPVAAHPVALTSPAPDADLGPSDPIRLTFSTTVRKALGHAHPTLEPNIPGRWRKIDSHTLRFTPSGYGAGFGTHLTINLPRSVAIADTSGRSPVIGRSVRWTIPPGSTLRLHQLLAQAGYLPVRWKPTGSDVAHNVRDEVHAAVIAPKGRFTWRYKNTPPELKALWDPKQASAITRGAVMMFQSEHGLDVDAVAGPALFKTLIAAAIKGGKRHHGYNYVYVHESVPQKLTLWSRGRTVMTSPGNTGIASAPTAIGTFPVFEHLPVTTMSGTNPNGSHYSDPGIQWVSYFNGGDALHAFPRASFGTPQSLGCVELPLASAAKVYPYTPIGTLVTIED